MNSSLKEERPKDRILLHDICNELSTIKLGLYLSMQKEKISEADRYLKESEKAVQNIENLIQKYREEME
ncbi:MAG: hypothetical protein L6Q33_04985 [Bacteriovoracaceae bacterium]|jgi:TPP-dependent 2-oxoacid decarboxylase|nr:hypothetical protein [Bacteriovoracaceae bacterium]